MAAWPQGLAQVRCHTSPVATASSLKSVKVTLFPAATMGQESSGSGMERQEEEKSFLYSRAQTSVWVALGDRKSVFSFIVSSHAESLNQPRSSES